MVQKLPRNEARVVVIGGGLAGCSVAWHLARAGMSDIVVLERAKLSSGTTWHSAGNMETYREDPLAFRMVRYAVESFPQLEQETGQALGWNRLGRVMYTDRPERLEQFRALPQLGRLRDIELEFLTPRQVQQRLPIIDSDGLLGGLWIPSDGRVNPTDLVTAYARGARRMGVSIVEDVPVRALTMRNGCISGVETDLGRVSTDIVVLAAGLWSNELAETCGARLPLHALEHFYLITKPIEGLRRDLPLFLSYDDQLYGREEVGGLLVGCLDDEALPVSSRELREDFAFSLLNERWDQFEPYMLKAMQRFPVLRNAEAKILLNGPESFTPDDKMLLGPVPGVSGLFVIAAMNSNGIALSPAAGRFLSEWILDGAPSVDVSPIDIRRFHECQATAEFMRERVTEVPGFACRIHDVGEDYRTARGIRRSPLHATLEQSGAHFVSVCGWERPHWFALTDERSQWAQWVAAEVAAAQGSLLLIDRSSDVKLGFYGPGAKDWIASLTPVSLAGQPQTLNPLVPLLGTDGSVQVLCETFTDVDGAAFLLAEPEQETRLKEYLRRLGVPSYLRMVDHTITHAALQVIGPHTPDAVNLGLPAGTWATESSGDAALVLLEAHHASRLWDALRTLAVRNGGRLGGFLARDALRIQAGVPQFGRETGPFRDVREILPQVRVDASLRLARDGTGDHRVIALASPVPFRGQGTGEAVLLGDRVVGHATSGMRLPGWSEALLLARVEREFAGLHTLELLASGSRWPLVQRACKWSGHSQR